MSAKAMSSTAIIAGKETASRRERHQGAVAGPGPNASLLAVKSVPVE